MVEALGPLGVRCELLQGGPAGAEKLAVLEATVAGQVHILVGTHALIESAVKFMHLGLVITDEQHKFGVAQRDRLLAKGPAPHSLEMSATPIPRSLALTAYGDRSIITNGDKPGNRQPVTTIHAQSDAEAYQHLADAVARGHQAYVICPLVEPNEEVDLRSAQEEFAKLTRHWPGRVGLLHGRLSDTAKIEAISAFEQGATAILVSTTVVEVGVSCPNATVIVISDCDRFGLAQLHQLRGRVGRGSLPGTCLLLSDSGSSAAAQRIETMLQSTDGFFIAERDLEMRGPGDVLGKIQAGYEFEAEMAEDSNRLLGARVVAQKILGGGRT
jgi:ATP-dependent DNA helicase RecG